MQFESAPSTPADCLRLAGSRSQGWCLGKVGVGPTGIHLAGGGPLSRRQQNPPPVGQDERVCMGYTMSRVGSQFFIAAEDADSALAAIVAMQARAEDMTGGSWDTATGARTEQYYSWMNDIDFNDFRSIEDALQAWGWPVTLDQDGNVIDIHFENEKMGDEDKLFDAIAPYVRPGSYIEMVGEEGDRWRWVFDGKTCKEVAAIVAFPSLTVSVARDEDSEDEEGWPVPWVPLSV